MGRHRRLRRHGLFQQMPIGIRPMCPLAQYLAKSATARLADVLLERWRTVRDVDRLQGLIQDQRHLAAGMIASLLGIRTQEALAVIRARAFSEGRTLADLSSEIVDTLGPRSSRP